MPKNFKLVYVDFRYNDEKDIDRSCMCAIGCYDNEDWECRRWDDNIFYWFEDEDEIKSFMKFDPSEEFTVVNYEITE